MDTALPAPEVVPGLVLAFAILAHPIVIGPLLCAGPSLRFVCRSGLQCMVAIVLLCFTIRTHFKIARPLLRAFSPDNGEGILAYRSWPPPTYGRYSLVLLLLAVTSHAKVIWPLFSAFLFNGLISIRLAACRRG